MTFPAEPNIISFPPVEKSTRVYFSAWFDSANKTYWGEWGGFKHRLWPTSPHPFLWVLCGILLTLLFFMVVFLWHSETAYPPAIELTSNERQQLRLEQPTFPKTITLRILSAEEIERRNSKAYALAVINARPCEIWIPSGQIIVANPHAKMAFWKNSYHGDVLAHEILHCLRGGWHDEADKENKQ